MRSTVYLSSDGVLAVFGRFFACILSFLLVFCHAVRLGGANTLRECFTHMMTDFPATTLLQSATQGGRFLVDNRYTTFHTSHTRGRRFALPVLFSAQADVEITLVKSEKASECRGNYEVKRGHFLHLPSPRVQQPLAGGRCGFSLDW